MAWARSRAALPALIVAPIAQPHLITARPLRLRLQRMLTRSSLTGKAPVVAAVYAK